MGFENSDFRIEAIDTGSPYDVKQVKEFLQPLGFDYSPREVDYTIMLYNLNGEVLGTGSHYRGVLKYVAVAPKFRETSAFAGIVTHLNNQVLAGGCRTVFVYTRPGSSLKFQGLGFKEIAVVKPLYAFLEFGYRNIGHYKQYLESERRDIPGGTAAAVVVNCNPFTNGHLYLIEKAASENDVVYLFAVQEDRSVFPFETRLRLIEEGTAHLDNLVILRGGSYVVSGATFPSYFLKNESEEDIANQQTELDVTVFAKHIAPLLNIRRRYVGTEVYCRTTNAYNESMKKVLPPAGIELVEVERKRVGEESNADNYISASKVRAFLREGNLEAVKDFLPPTTYAFLTSGEAAGIIEKIKTSGGRH